MSTKWMGKGEWGVCASQRCQQSQTSNVVQPVGGVMWTRTASVELTCSVDMDLNDTEQRLNFLDCLRENATNMRIEQQKIRDRITAAIVQARINLSQIRKLNEELHEMQESVGNALKLSEAKHDRFEYELDQRIALMHAGEEYKRLHEGQQICLGKPVQVDQNCMTDDDVTNWSSIEKELLAQHPELQ